MICRAYSGVADLVRGACTAFMLARYRIAGNFTILASGGWV
jgi:hypothetical protein